MLVLLTGGARSGKSQLALRLAQQRSSPVTFIATAQAGDSEMAERIARHRDERPAAWRTIEEPLHVKRAIDAAASESSVVIDCLTLWVANALAEFGATETEARALGAAETAGARDALTIAVTNDVGLGLVPENALGRAYRDLLGRVNTIWSAAADHALLVVAGRAIALPNADDMIEALR